MNTSVYYPPSMSEGLWRMPKNDTELSEKCGFDRAKLDDFFRFHAFINAGETYGIVLVRNGYIAAEYYTPDMRVNSMMHVYSCTKAMTSLALGMLLEEKKDEGITLESKAYDYIPVAFPLTDERKKDITIAQLLSMSAGFPGEGAGALGVYGIDPAKNELDYVLGSITGPHGTDFGTLSYDPGTSWDYSCAGYCQLSLLFQNIAKRKMGDYVKEKLLTPIGIENSAWESFGGFGRGTYSAGEEGFTISARDFARIGYLLLHNGVWEGRQIIPSSYIKKATTPSQPFNRDYGFGFWVNGSKNPVMPVDFFAMKGHKVNRLCVIPSLDLVITRVGMGPNSFNDDEFIGQILNALI